MDPTELARIDADLAKTVATEAEILAQIRSYLRSIDGCYKDLRANQELRDALLDLRNLASL